MDRTTRHTNHFGKYRRITLPAIIALSSYENHPSINRFATHFLKSFPKRHIRCAQTQIHHIHLIVNTPLNRRNQRSSICHQRFIKNPHAIQCCIRSLLPNNPGTRRTMPCTVGVIIQKHNLAFNLNMNTTRNITHIFMGCVYAAIDNSNPDLRGISFRHDIL